MIFQAEEEENGDGEDGPFSPAALQRYGFEALVQEIFFMFHSYFPMLSFQRPQSVMAISCSSVTS